MKQYTGIDPGHGGNDSGAVGVGGWEEKKSNLAIGLELNRILKENGYQTFMTRTTDEWFGDGYADPISADLNARCNLLNQAKVYRSISIHSNEGGGNYLAVYVYSYDGKSEVLGRKVWDELHALTGWPAAADGAVLVKNLAMVRKPYAYEKILIEIGFVDKAEHAAWLSNPVKQKQLAKAIAKAVVSQDGGSLIVPQWKLDIIAKAKQLGLITEDHDPDEVAAKWFVLGVAINLCKIFGKS